MDEQVCPECKGPLTARPAAHYPIVSQIFFALSFLAFLWLQESLPTALRWIWTLAQVALGFWVVRGRLRAQKRIYRCVRCGAALP